MSDTVLYYIHDPMCSWCWGFAPTWRALREALPAEVRVEYLLGGLAADTDEPMPEAQRQQIEQTWQRIHDKLGTEFNFDFWRHCRPRRATYPACRAVIAAQHQDAGEAMIEAIQHAYYLRAMNPSDDDTLIRLADELALDTQRFSIDLNSPATRAELTRQLTLATQLGARGFPSLVLDLHGSRWPVAVDYRSAAAMLEQITLLRETA